MYYNGTVVAVLLEIKKRSKTDGSRECELVPGKPAPFEHLRWMCEQIMEMDTSSWDDATKAGRWIAWICAHMEFRKIWNNNTSREMIRLDVKVGFHIPHLT